MLAYVKRSGAIKQSKECLLSEEHWKFASTRWKGGISIEQPHNSIHVACGYPMSSIRYAAFDILFWLHHNNIERIITKYYESNPDS